jgi:hypothetical protein
MIAWQWRTRAFPCLYFSLNLFFKLPIEGKKAYWLKAGHERFFLSGQDTPFPPRIFTEIDHWGPGSPFSCPPFYFAFMVHEASTYKALVETTCENRGLGVESEDDGVEVRGACEP